MRSILHTLLIWLLLLAVPVQGFAAAGRILCEPIATPAVATVQMHHHDHAQMSADDMQMQQNTHQDHTKNPSQQNHHDHAQSKCGACAACCFGASISAPASAVMPAVHTDSEQIIALDSFPTSIVPDHPDRPPQVTST